MRQPMIDLPARSTSCSSGRRFMKKGNPLCRYGYPPVHLDLHIDELIHFDIKHTERKEMLCWYHILYMVGRPTRPLIQTMACPVTTLDKKNIFSFWWVFLKVCFRYLSGLSLVSRSTFYYFCTYRAYYNFHPYIMPRAAIHLHLKTEWETHRNSKVVSLITRNSFIYRAGLINLTWVIPPSFRNQNPKVIKHEALTRGHGMKLCTKTSRADCSMWTSRRKT